MRTYVFDTECYNDYFLVMFKDIANDKVAYFEKYEGKDLDYRFINAFLNNRVVGFNSKSYDIPILSYAMTGASCSDLKKLSDDIILNGLKWWEAGDLHGFKLLKTDHIDLINVAIGQAGLKTYGGRLHSNKLQDLPFDPDLKIDDNMRDVLRTYCENDLQLTQDLFNHLLPALRLRVAMGKKYDLDLRSKSDAQIAEAVIAKEIEMRTGSKCPVSNVNNKPFKYVAPDFISFKNEQLNDLLKEVTTCDFVVEDGKLNLPEELEKRIITIGKQQYKMGIGGLHSMEKSVMHKTEECKLYDRDVTSYYPSIILNCNLFPKHLGEVFLDVYRDLFNRRVQAKRDRDQLVSDTYKIVLNGSYGKFGNKYSKLYSPHLLIQTTITGQLSLLMLIEMIEESENEVLSANTDGVLIKSVDDEMYSKVIKTWEDITGFNTEEVEYKAVYHRDVNNYIAVGDYVKTKGEYTAGGLSKNPVNEICNIALCKFLEDGTDFHTTIRECRDVTKFTTLRAVKGGAVKDGEYLGKVVRWYYSTETITAIHYQGNGNMVARSEGGKPLMELGEFPSDINYEWYIEEVKSMLEDIGACPKREKLKRTSTKGQKKKGTSLEKQDGKVSTEHQTSES